MQHDEVIAVPSMSPGGLQANRSGHFGRCDVFTLVALKDGKVESVRAVANTEHAEGGCLVPVQILQLAGATSLVVSGIGMRPAIGFAQAGITVLVGPGETVGQVIEAYQAAMVRPITEEDLCGGSHSHG